MARPYKYTPQQIWDKFIEYQELNKKNVYNRPELIKSGDMAGTVVNVELIPPLTIVGFAVHLNVTHKTLCEWFNDTDKEGNTTELCEVSTRIRDIIQSDQLSGASVNVFNPAIIARLIGLTDKQEINHTGESQSVNINIDGSKLDLTR